MSKHNKSEHYEDDIESVPALIPLRKLKAVKIVVEEEEKPVGSGAEN